MRKFNLEINDTKLKCFVANKAEDRKVGYSGEDNVPDETECMLFVFPEPGDHKMWMKNTHCNLDIIFLDKDCEILEIVEGKEDDDTLLGSSDNVAFVLEFMQGGADALGLKVGDIVDTIPDEYLEPSDDEVYSMFVLDEEGNVQMKIKGGERIFSRAITKKLVNLALSAETDTQFKKLGKMILKEILAQDERGPDHVKGRTKDSYELDK